MPGTNPDPAESMDFLEFLESRLIPATAVAATEAATKAVVTAAKGASEFQSNTITLSPASSGAQPVIILGLDRSRTRALIRASVADVYIGTLQQLSGGFGYPVPTQAGDEIKTIGEVYVAYIPSGAADPNPRVSVWAERSA